MKSHFARGFAHDLAALDVNQLFGIDGGGPERQPPVVIEGAMRNGALMPELNEDQPACAMNGIGNALPSGALFCGVDSWGSVPSLSLLAYEGALRDDQAGPGPLSVILGHQLVRHLSPVLGSGARERSHDDAILELQIAERDRA